MKQPSFKDVLPEYPSTVHLPWKPNNRGDKIASAERAAKIFEYNDIMKGYPFIAVEEKVDGANCGMAYLDGHPVVRTRTKILRKGQELKNASQKQFASAWNWMHDHKSCFDKLEACGPYSVYGEWMIQQHGLVYDYLPSWFIAYDIYNYEKEKYVDSKLADETLRSCGFEVVPLSFYGKNDIEPQITYKFLEEIANEKTRFAQNKKREGIVVKLSDGEFIFDKFKMVREGFEQGCLLGDEIKRNKLKGKE